MPDGTTIIAVMFRNHDTWRESILSEEEIAYIAQAEIDRNIPVQFRGNYFFLNLSTDCKKEN